MAADKNLDMKIKISADGKSAVGEIEGVAAATREAEAGTKGLAGAYGTLATAVGTVAGAGAVLALATTADEVRILRDRVRAVVGESGDWRAVWQDIYEISQQNGAAVADTVQLYQRLSTSAERLGATSEGVLAVVRAVQQLGRLGGSTAEEIRQVSVQFGQMLASPIAQAEELNSILDGMPMLAREIEQGLGLMPGGLKQAVLAGLETSKIFDVLLRQAGDIDQRAQAAAGSIAMALQAMTNTLGAGLNSLDEALGAGGKSWTDRWSSGVSEIARRLDGLNAKFRQVAVGSEAGVDPRLKGQERLNALLEQHRLLIEQADDAQQRWAYHSARSGLVPGAARQAALARAEIKGLQQDLDTTARAIERTRAGIAAATPVVADLAAQAVQAGLAAANAGYAGAAGFTKLRTDVASAQAALASMSQALKGPAPEATVTDRLREIVAMHDQAKASLETGDLQGALPSIKQGAALIEAFIRSGGTADATIGSLAQAFRDMGAAAAKGAKDGKDAVDAAARAMKATITVTPVLDEAALAAIVAKLRRAAVVTPQDLAAAGLAGADRATGPATGGRGATITPGNGSASADRAAGAAGAMADAAARTAERQATRAATPLTLDARDTAEAARRVVEQVFKQPLPLALDASAAAAAVVRQVQAALNGAGLTVPVTAVVTQVQGGAAGGAADLAKAADKTGTRQG